MTNNRLKGFTYGAVAAASYGMNPLFALPLYGAGMSVDSVLFYRYFFAVVMLGILMKVKKQSFALKKADILPLAVMGLLFSFSSFFLFESYNYMDAGIASTILFVYPVLVAIIMAVFFHEKVSFITMFSIALAFTGISLLYEGGDGKTLSMLGVLFVILSSLTYAIYIVFRKKERCVICSRTITLWEVCWNMNWRKKFIMPSGICRKSAGKFLSKVVSKGKNTKKLLQS